MPTYTYFCVDCNKMFELFSYIKDYNANPHCPKCYKLNTNRMYDVDVMTQSASVKKGDSELKTLGDLAQRNTDRMSEDQKIELYMKHNAYKEDNLEKKPLPSGMSRIKKGPKPIWPGSKNTKIKRSKKK